MATLTIGEAKTHLSYCSTAARTLLSKLEPLPQNGSVVVIGPVPTPVPFAKCMHVDRSHLIVADYVQGLREIVTWLNDLIDGLNVPEGRRFTEEQDR